MASNQNADFSGVRPFREAGRVGIQEFSGIIDEDFVDDLTGREKLKTLKEFARNDATAYAILYALNQLMKQTDFNVRPASSDQEDLRAAEFLKQTIEDMEHSISDMVGQINTRHTYGFAPMEIVYKRREGDNSQFDDGLVGWKKIEIRRPDTLHEWLFDRENDNKLIGLRQQDPSTFEYRDIPIEKLLLFTVQGEGGNPEGRSLLRGAYRSWKFKKRIEELEAIGIERGLAGLPIVYAPEEYFAEDADDDQVSILNQLEKMVQNVRRNENEGLVMPMSRDEDGNKRFELELLQSSGERQIDPSETIQRLREQIATSLLADFMLLGQGDQVGSFAMSEDKSSFFTLATESLLDDIDSKMNEKAIPKLFEFNNFDIQEYPKLEHEKIRKDDIVDVGSTLKDIAAAGAQPFVQDEQNELLNTILDRLDLPTVEEQLDSPSPETDIPPPLQADETSGVDNE